MKKLFFISVSVLFCSTLFSQEFYYFPSPNNSITTYSKNNLSVGIHYNFTSQFLGGISHYPELSVSYNLLDNFAIFGGATLNNSSSYFFKLFSEDKNSINNNHSYYFGFSALNKINFWFLTHYEIALGFHHQFNDVTFFEKSYDSSIKKVLNSYNTYSLQFSFLKNTGRIKWISSIKASISKITRFVNIAQNDHITNYLNETKVNSPFFLALSGSCYIPFKGSENLFFKVQFSISTSTNELKIKGGSSFYSNELLTSNLSVGLVYQFNKQSVVKN